jgi:acetyl-CoA carboxylase carboxyl transferase subunit alpha
VLSLVDTAGAYPGIDAEARGQAEAIARAIETCLDIRVPLVAAVIGEGGSGGAIALAAGNTVLMLEHAIYSVISPEGAAAILYRDVAQAQSLSTALKITAHDLKRLGVIDEIIPEPEGGAHLDHAAAAAAVAAHVTAALRALRRVPVSKLPDRRYEKYRHIGRTGIYWREVVRGEMQEALDALARRFPRGEGPWRRVRSETNTPPD